MKNIIFALKCMFFLSIEICLNLHIISLWKTGTKEIKRDLSKIESIFTVFYRGLSIPGSPTPRSLVISNYMYVLFLNI